MNILRLTTSHGGGDGQIWVNKIIFEVLGSVVMVLKYCIDWHSDGIVVHTSWVVKFPTMPWEVNKVPSHDWYTVMDVTLGVQEMQL